MFFVFKRECQTIKLFGISRDIVSFATIIIKKGIRKLRISFVTQCFACQESLI